MQFVDKALARRLESAEEIPQVTYARLYAQLRPEIGAAAEEICGGHMIFAGLNSPIGRAVGMGFCGPVKDTDLDRLEAFYRSHNAPAQVDVCPLTDPSLMELVKTRSYCIAELNDVLFRRLDTAAAVSAPRSVVIRRGSAQDAAIVGQMLTHSFFPNGDAPQGFADLLAPMFQVDGVLTFLACVNENPVGVAAALVIPKFEVLALFGAGTLPEFRGRGIQGALLHERMNAGKDAGCELAVVVTQGGSTSERNCLRQGFQVAYSKATVLKQVEQD